MRTRRRPGFTMLELMVVIGIISVLISLLLPAVQSARESARRTQCANNLIQIGLAIHGYEASHRCLPPGSVNAAGPITSSKPGYQFGWIARILPYLEQKEVYRNLDFRVPVEHPANLTARSVSMNVLICPSEVGWGRAAAVNGQGLGPSAYVACHNSTEAPIDVGNDGVFFLNSRVRYEDITDGLASTIFVGETRAGEINAGWASGTPATLRNTGVTPNAPPAGLIPVPPEAGGVVAGDEDTKPLMIRPNLVGGFSSPHPMGANFGFADGSVRFVKNSIDGGVFRALGSRNGGELVSADQF